MFFHISEARSQKSRCQHGWFFLEALWEKLPLLASDGWQQSSIPWVIDTSTSICLHLHVAFFSVSLCPFLSLIGTFIGLRARSNPVWSHLNIILITSTKTWSPNKVTFWGYTWIIGGTLQSATEGNYIFFLLHRNPIGIMEIIYKNVLWNYRVLSVHSFDCFHALSFRWLWQLLSCFGTYHQNLKLALFPNH